MYKHTASNQHHSSAPREPTTTTPFKFAFRSQETLKDTPTQENAIIGTKRSTVDANSDTALVGSMKRRNFDPIFPQSLSSQRAEPYITGGSPFSSVAAEPEDIKPFALRTSSRLTSEPVDGGFTSRQFVSSARESSNDCVKADTQEPNFERSAARSSASMYLLKFQEEMVHEHEELRLQLAAKIEDNVTLSGEIARLETANHRLTDKYRDSIGRAAKNYAALKSELDTLKTSSNLFLSQAKEAKEGCLALRVGVQASLQDCKAMFDEAGGFIPTAGTRETVLEFRAELSKTQQVADLLRDKLHTMGSELAEARNRIAELEEMTATDRERSESIAVKMNQTTNQLLEVTKYLQEQKHESLQANTKATEMEQQLMHAQTSLRDAQSAIASMKEEMTAGEELHEEQGAKLRTLHHTIEFQEGNVKAIEARAQRIEEELLQARNRNHELQSRLESSMELEKNSAQQASRLLSDCDNAKAKVQSLERQFAEVQVRENMHRENECQVSLKILRERFDHQCLTLAASKESIGEMQETLGKFTCEMAQLRGQNEVLATRLHRADREIVEKSDSLQALQLKLSREEGAFQALLEAERLSKEEALQQSQDTQTKVQSLLAEVAQKDHQVKEMAERLTAVESPSGEKEAAALKLRIAELEVAEKRLTERAATITRRYKENDLNDDEKAFVTQLLQRARSIHDREIVEKTNALRLRDTVIKQHVERIEQLENSLSRRLQEESSAKCNNEQGNSMTVDVRKPQRPSDHHLETRGAGHEAPSAIVTHGAAEGTTVNLSLPSRSSGSTTFAKLSREDADEIASFEDEKPPVATGKRVIFAESESESESLRPTRRVKQGRASGVEKLAVDRPEAVVPDFGAGSGPGTGNRKKAAPKRR